MRAAVWVFLLAWLARGAYLAVATRGELFGGLFLDARLFADSARAIRSGAAPLLGTAPYELSPLYPMFLALFPSMAEPAATNAALDVRLVQAALGALTCALAAVAAGRLAGRRAGWIAGITAALYGPAIHFDGAVLVASLSALLLTASLVLLIGPPPGRSPGRSPGRTTGRATAPSTSPSTIRILVAGLALGAAAALRPTALLVAATAAVAVALVGRSRTPLARLRSAATLVLGTALLVAPFTVQNLRAGERLLLTAGGGFNFWVGNHAGADGTFRAPEGYDPLWDPVGRQLAESGLDVPLGYAGSSYAFFSLARVDASNDPAAWFATLGRKVWLFFHPLEIPQLGAGFDWHRERAWPLRLPLDARWILLLALAAPLARRAAQRPGLGLAIPLTLLATYAAGLVLFFVTARHRAPILPLGIVLAAVTVDGTLRALARERRATPAARRLFAALGLLLATGLLAFRTAPDIPSGTVEERHRGLALYERGEYEEAVRVLGEAVEVDPSPKTRIALALALRELGRHGEAKARARARIDDPARRPRRHLSSRDSPVGDRAQCGRRASPPPALDRGSTRFRRRPLQPRRRRAGEPQPRGGRERTGAGPRARAGGRPVAERSGAWARGRASRAGGSVTSLLDNRGQYVQIAGCR